MAILNTRAMFLRASSCTKLLLLLPDGFAVSPLVVLPEEVEADACKGSEKTADSTELKGFPLVKDETTLERAFNAGGMPAKANGAITREGSNGSANKNVARASGPEKRVEIGVCRGCMRPVCIATGRSGSAIISFRR